GRPNRLAYRQTRPVPRSCSRKLPSRGESRPHRDLSPGTDTELGADMLDVCVDGPDRHTQGPGDVGVGEPVRDEVRDLELSRGERTTGDPGFGPVRGSGLVAQERPQCRRGELRVSGV